MHWQQFPLYVTYIYSISVVPHSRAKTLSPASGYSCTASYSVVVRNSLHNQMALSRVLVDRCLLLSFSAGLSCVCSKLILYAKETKQLVLNVLGTMRKECAKGASSSSIIKRTAPLTNGSERTPAQVDVTKGIERRFRHSIRCCMLAEWSCFCAWSRGVVDCPHDSRYAIFVTADRHHTRPFLLILLPPWTLMGSPSEQMTANRLQAALGYVWRWARSTDWANLLQCCKELLKWSIE